MRDAPNLEVPSYAISKGKDNNHKIENNIGNTVSG